MLSQVAQSWMTKQSRTCRIANLSKNGYKKGGRKSSQHNATYRFIGRWIFQPSILSHLQMNWNKWERLHRQKVSYQLTLGHKTGLEVAELLAAGAPHENRKKTIMKLRHRSPKQLARTQAEKHFEKKNRNKDFVRFTPIISHLF